LLVIPHHTKKNIKGDKRDRIKEDGGIIFQPATTSSFFGRPLLGQPIGSYDIMIAGHARAMGLILITNNMKTFERVPGLRVENWV